ncbi:ribosomal large subunit pseudouridine synthase D [Ectothiorhodosinus mongolicus]|uniref:Pseudouridine synthase n=1 Tax=Ectothiorhodosinus mongolicus TaxID=233100 RepID=A0A1R3VSP3_9GAMM|nr:23S rRNA pseudouridine(1911/1915/1917) synthase RluD [Ectothiorhodosinus mongolicus]ULX56660.1 23S rRNA pseudouridine(1911/1915/1917) synthase RluD [Ectothiorhodosinus mongolicus]SIT66698.1 ribosomal large subunit pseudouridine synthase D [Ectothiorhodosinus mongolicus]
MSKTRIQLQTLIPEDFSGQRLDSVLAQLFSDYSRSRLQQWIQAGEVLLDGRTPRVRDKVLGGEQVLIDAAQDVAVSEDVAQPLPLDLIYEDEHLLVIHKPAGLVVHPAVGHPQGTLVNALLHYAPELASLPRAGIVHRLDKETSGLLVVARTLRAHTDLVRQLQARSVSREYLALVQGEMISGGTVDEPIGRHPVDRKRMAVVANGREAITHYRVEQRYSGFTLLRVKLETGRTHQIRVHMAHIRYPIVGDPTYGGRLRLPAGLSEAAITQLQQLRRQALHAARLGLVHPETGEALVCEAPLPDDFAQLLPCLDAKE